MTDSRIPEVRFIEGFLVGIQKSPSSGAAFSAIIGIAASASPGESREALFALIQAIDTLDRLCEERFERHHEKAMAQTVVRSLRSMLEPKHLNKSFDAFRQEHHASVHTALAILPLLGTLRYDADALLGHRDEIVSQVDALRAKVLSDDVLPDAAKHVIAAQLHLVNRSILRFETSGIGPFRDSLFCTIGRIEVVLKGETAEVRHRGNELADEVLRIYGLAQLAGDIASLAGPVIAGLLTGPA